MKSRASLVLMEGLIMLLVFALASAVCLQIFVKTDARSRQTQLETDALVLAQNAAEELKAAAGDLEAVADALGGSVHDDVLTLRADGLCLEITGLPSDVAGLGKALIKVTWEETGESLFSLTTGWQEVAQ